MEQYLIDTNAVSHYLSALLPEVGMDFMDNLIDSTPNLSTALANNFTLVTDNEKDFINIPKLKIVNPKKL